MAEVTWSTTPCDGVHCELLCRELRADTARFACVAYDDDYFDRWRLVLHATRSKPSSAQDIRDAIAAAASRVARDIESIAAQSLALFSEVPR